MEADFRHNTNDNCGNPEHDRILAEWYARSAKLLDQLNARHASGVQINLADIYDEGRQSMRRDIIDRAHRLCHGLACKPRDDNKLCSAHIRMALEDVK